MDRVFNPKGKLIIENVHAWMDGGTVTIITTDSQLNDFEIEFVQKVSLERRYNLPSPGSLLLDKREVEIRSEMESKILASVTEAEWGSKIIEEEKELLGRVIAECMDFVKSDQYVEIARKVGRIN